jgi:tetratricopeptide (TPR) repeat protein
LLREGFSQFEAKLRDGDYNRALRFLYEVDRLSLPERHDIDGWLSRYRLNLYLHRFDQAVEVGESIIDQTRDYRYIQSLYPFFFAASDLKIISAHIESYLRVTAERLNRSMDAKKSPWYYLFMIGISKIIRIDDRNNLINSLRKYATKIRYAWMRNDVGAHFHRVGKYSEAIQELSLVRNWIRPGHWQADCLIAEAKIGKGQLNDAFLLFDSARNSAPHDKINEVLAWEAQLYLWTGQYKRSLEIFKLIPDNGSSPYALCWHGGALLQLGDPVNALKILDRAIQESPGDGEAYVWRSQALLVMGRPQEALRDTDFALKLNPNEVFAHSLRILSLLALGLKTEAYRDYQSLLSQVPLFVRDILKSDEMKPSIDHFLILSRGIRRTYGLSLLKSLIGRPRRRRR